LIYFTQFEGCLDDDDFVVSVEGAEVYRRSFGAYGANWSGED